MKDITYDRRIDRTEAIPGNRKLCTACAGRSAARSGAGLSTQQRRRTRSGASRAPLRGKVRRSPSRLESQFPAPGRGNRRSAGTTSSASTSTRRGRARPRNIGATSPGRWWRRPRPDRRSPTRHRPRGAFGDEQLGLQHQPPCSRTADAAELLRWLSENTRPLRDLAAPGVALEVLEAATSRLDGQLAAPDTVRKHRMLPSNAMDYAVEPELLETTSIKAIKWGLAATGTTREVDRRSVVNHRQARALLEAVKAQQPSGPRLVASFALMYYSGLRPEEAVNVDRNAISLPPATEPDGWGDLHLTSAPTWPTFPTVPTAGSSTESEPRPSPRRRTSGMPGRTQGCPHAAGARLLPGPAALRPTARVP